MSRKESDKIMAKYFEITSISGDLIHQAENGISFMQKKTKMAGNTTVGYCSHLSSLYT